MSSTPLSIIEYDADNIRLFIDRFNTGRWATQGELNRAKAQTAYYPGESCDLTPDLVQRHLDGKITLASYVIGSDRTCKFMVIDFDISSLEAKGAVQKPGDAKAQKVREDAIKRLQETYVRPALIGLTEHLRIGTNQYLLESSGCKGFHVWLFFENPLPSEKAYLLANVVKKELSLYDFETYPKQSNLDASGTGSAIKLPLGINRKTQNRCLFLGQDFNNDTRGQWQALADVEYITDKQIEDILSLTDTVANKIEAGGCGHEATKNYGGDINRMISRCAALSSVKETVENADPDGGGNNIPHAWRVVIANLFMQFKEGREYAHKWLSVCDNYDEDKTNKQLDGLEGKNAITCEKMISQGLCSGRCEEIEKAGGFSPFKLAFGGKMKDDKLHILKNLAQIENPIFCGKRIQVEFQVSSLIGTPYFSTKSITFDECNEMTCPKYEKGCNCSTKSCKKIVDIPTTDKTHIEVFGLDDTRAMSIVKCGRIPGCINPKALYNSGSQGMLLVQPFLCSNVVTTIAEDETEKKFSAEDCTKESMMAAKEYKDYMTFFTGNTLETSKTYVGEGTVLANPKNQSITVLFDKAEPKHGQIDGFNLDNDEDLAAFMEWKNMPMQDKIDDFRENICMIYGRDEIIMAMMLVIFSSLEFTFNAAHQKGWVEAIFIGDSGQAKSKVVERITTYAGVGAIIGQNCSVAGLIGGNEQYKDQRYITWGIMPRNNKGLIFLDEFQEFRVDVISALRTVRSTGIATINKMKGGQHEAKCRLICAANPRDRKSMAEYQYGAESLTGIMGAADIRRFDLACFLAEDDVDKSVINQRAKNTTPKISRRVFQTAILWAWSRHEDQIIFSDDVTQEILNAAQRISQRYNTDIVPLCNTADMREKISRMTCAIAAFLGKTPDNEHLVPEIEDVKSVEKFLNDIYSKPSVGLDKLAVDRKRETTVDDEQINYLLELINSDKETDKRKYGKMMAIMKNLVDADLRTTDLISCVGATPEEVSVVLKEFMTLNLVKPPIGGLYQKQPKLVKMFRALEDRLSLKKGLFDEGSPTGETLVPVTRASGDEEVQLL